MRTKRVIKKVNFPNLRGFKDARAYVGWFEDSKYDDNTRVGDVAYYQEYGTARGIPQRPFMRPAEMKNKNKWVEILRQEVGKCVKNGSSLKNALGILGDVVQGDIQQAIIDVTQPPLSESAIRGRLRRRGNKKRTATVEKPLIDTGTMLASVQSEAEDVG